MKALIAGLGSIGRRHLSNLQSLGVEDFVLLRSRRSTLPDDNLNLWPTECTIEAALAHRPDVAVIATPTSLHLPTALACVRAGLTVFVEKPVSHSLDGCDVLQDALHATGRGLLVGFHFRFNPGLRRMRELCARGAIGTVVSANVHWGEWLPGWHPWEDYRQGYAARPELGGGVVLTLSHPFDYLRFILLDEAEQVFASLGYSGGLGIEVEDSADVQLRFCKGAQATVHLDYVQRPPSHHLQIIGTEGTVSWNNTDSIVRLWTAAAGAWQEFPPPQDFERNSMFLDEMRHLLDVAAGAAPVCTLQDGLATQRITHGVHQSARENRPLTLQEEYAHG